MKPRIAVHKFSSCDGCQLAFLNLGPALLELAGLVDIVHFAEAGLCDEEAQVAIAFVEGSVSTAADQQRILRVREQCDVLVTIGACATSGGLQALRNLHDAHAWHAGIYARPDYLDSLDRVSAIREHVKVDLELWGCPVNGRQLLAAVRSLLFGVAPETDRDKVCMECKRAQNVCVMVTQGSACQGPVTRSGCGAICPRFGRACYGCYGPAEAINTTALANRLAGLGLEADAIQRRLLAIHSHCDEFAVLRPRQEASDD